jgi:hypothetical protein
VLDAKQSEGVLNLRFESEAIVSYLFAVGDGFALQALSDPERDNSAALAAGAASARHLLVAE